jgi:hypothetical protein
MQDQLIELATEARIYQPRLFTIYGRFHNLDNPDFVGWGMSFEDLNKTVYFDPDSTETHRADTPENLMRFYANIATARLEWLDEQ